MKKKQDLDTKVCVVCQRPFAWRKKWQDCWDEVKYCSQRCRRQGPPAQVKHQQVNHQSPQEKQ